MPRSTGAVLGTVLLLAAPAAAITSNLTRTFTGNVLLDFDALPLGTLAPGTELAPGVVFDGAYPPFVTGVAATVTDTGGGNRVLELGPGQSAGFTFDPPVTDVGAAVEQIVAGTQVSVYALDDGGGYLWGFGYIYVSGESERFPEVTDATETPISQLLIRPQGSGTYRVDDLEYVPEPGSAAASAAALVALAALARRRA
jgi:hypothetical protein